MCSCRWRGRGSRGGRGASREHSTDGWEEWGGYMNAKKQKLVDQDLPSAVETNIFKGISVFVNGYTNPSCHEIKKLVTSNGGVYHHYYTRTKVTHIIASNLPTSKINQIRDEKVVKPDWITDSLKAGKLLPYQRYLLYQPPGAGNAVQHFFQSKPPAANSGGSVLQSGASSSVVSDEMLWDTTARETGDLSLAFTSRENSASVTDELVSSFATKFHSIETPPPNMPGLGTSSQTGVDSASDEELFPVEELEKESHLTDEHHPESSSVRYLQAEPVLPMADADEDQLSTENRKRVAEFFSHSRLHYISMWGAEYKAYVAALQTQDNPKLPGRDALRQTVSEQLSGVADAVDPPVSRFSKVVAHVDMDCFFVSVGLRSRPHLRGKPVAVTHSRGKGPHQSHGGSEITKAPVSGADAAANSMAEIASCSYEARQAGVKNGMLFGRARKLCPSLQPIPYDFDAYRSVSQILYDTVASYTRDIEAVSCDEMFIDCTDLLADTGASPLQFATVLRQEIYDKTGCTASAGFGENMLQARMATRVAKPNGQFWLQTDKVVAFMFDKKVEDLPGVGYSMSSKLANLGVVTCGDLQKMSVSVLQSNFGPKTGQTLYDHCRGKDDRTFRTGIERKSVSAEMNYGIRFSTLVEIDNFLGQFAAEVQGRLARLNKRCKVITLKLRIRHPDAPKVTAKFMGCGMCDCVSKSSTLALATDSVDVIAGECRALVRSVVFDPSDLRGVAVQLTGLEPVKGVVGATGCRSILDFALPTASSVASVNTVTATAAAAASSDSLNDVSMVDRTVLPAADDLDAATEEVDSNKQLPEYAAVCDAVRKHVIARPQRNDSLPPLPTLDDSQEINCIESPRRPERTAECDWHLPSFSQIDPSVLNALPDDIRSNILKAVRPSVTVGDVQQQPGCSHWETETSGNTIVDPDQLPTCSQLDASFMAALPEDIQDEIRKQCSTADRAADAVLPQIHPLMRPEIVNSPSKHSSSAGKSPKKNSPSKLGVGQTSPRKNSSPFKAPVGNPPRRRKYTKRKKLLPAATKTIQTSAALPTLDNISVGLNVPSIVAQPSVSSSDVPSETVVEKESIDEMKSLVREWVSTCSCPSSEDLEAFVLYLVQQIDSCDLERVAALLKFIHRLTQRGSSSAEWKNGGLWIINQTQAIVKSTYGGVIKMAA